MKALEKLSVKENISLLSSATLEDVISLLCKSSLGLVVFTNPDNIPLGVITEREVLQLLKDGINTSEAINRHFDLNHVITIHKDRSSEYALHILLDNSIRRLIVVNEDKTLYGIINQEILIEQLENGFFQTDYLIGNFIHEYKELISVKETTSIKECIDILFEKNIGAVVVKNNNNTPIGILTEGDFVKLSLSNISYGDPVSLYMTKDLITATKNQSVHEVVDLMREKHIDKILIKNDIGVIEHIISLRDITKLLQGNYERLLENKLKTLKNSLNYIGEYIIEVYKDKGEYIIQWMNQKGIEKLGNHLDSPITSLLDSQVWELIHYNLQHTSLVNNYKIRIQDFHFELTCSNHFVNEKETLLFVLKDITEIYQKLQKVEQDNDALKFELNILQNIIDNQTNIIFVTDGFEISIANKSFLNFFNMKNIDELKQSVKSLPSKFISHDGFYSPKKSGVNWIDDIQNTKENISMIDINCLEPKVFNPNITKLQNSNEQYLVTLEDITEKTLGNDQHYYNATHDFMTNSYNRSFFLETLNNSIYKSKRYNLHFSIIEFNIDNLMEVNETYGYLEGDTLINNIITIVKENIRTSDILARYDNDDFIILLPQTTAIKCELVCENLKKSINSSDFKIKASVSFGITEYHVSDNSSTIIQRAKNALLKAKNNGKNCFAKL